MLLHVISYCFVFTVELSHTLCVHQGLFTLLLMHLDNFQIG